MNPASATYPPLAFSVPCGCLRLGLRTAAVICLARDSPAWSQLSEDSSYLLQVTLAREAHCGPGGFSGQTAHSHAGQVSAGSPLGGGWDCGPRPQSLSGVGLSTRKILWYSVIPTIHLISRHEGLCRLTGRAHRRHPSQWEECPGHFVRRECGIGDTSMRPSAEDTVCHHGLNVPPCASLMLRVVLIPTL